MINWAEHSHRITPPSTDPVVQHDALAAHIHALQSIPALARSQIVLGVECNLGFESHHILTAMRRRNVAHIPLFEGPQDGPGILTTNASKEIMCVATQELLDQQRLLVSRRFVCTTASPLEAIETLSKELRTYTIVVEPPRNPFGKPRRTYTGKVGGHNDDLCIALQLAVLSMRIFNRSEKYTRFAR